MIIAGVPVEGLSQQQAADRLTQAYSLPVELHYGNNIIHVKPAMIGFKPDLEGMLAAADMQRASQPFWPAFWDYLWNRLPAGGEIPLRAKISDERLRTYLRTEIASRYDQSPVAGLPVAGSAEFQMGKMGTTLDIERAIALMDDALRSPTSRVVNLTYGNVNPPRPSFQNLQILLQQIIDAAGFDGLAELYLLDLQTNQEMHFAYRQGNSIAPNVAFTAASTIKIPIMVSVFRRLKEPPPNDVIQQVELMIEYSENDSADRLMESMIDKATGPLKITEDLQTLGFKNSFLGGYFYPGAPLLKRYSTPANQRTDVNTKPDIYNQTTVSEISMLLNDIYQCADTGGGALAAVFPGEISQNECRQMITYLTRNKIPVLITAGIPDGTTIAHKHGWVTEPADGLIHSMSDAGIVYTPGGNFILSVFLYQPTQLVFDPANLMVAQMAKAIYNFYNLKN